MTAQEIAAAMRRVEAVLRRRPEAGLHDDAPATASWQGGTRVVASHANGTRLATDMPGEFGGSADQVTPGWLFRAGLAACTATCVAMRAAAAGIELATLDVVAGSRTDSRGMLGMTDGNGTPVPAGPREVHLEVRIGAPGVAPERLRALVEESCRCSPIAAAIETALPVALRIEIDAG